MECPKGHLNSPDIRICIGCGYIFPLSPNTLIGELQVIEHAFELPGRNIYWAKDSKLHTWLLSEAKEIYNPNYRQRLYELQRAFAMVLGEPPVDYWHEENAISRLIYTLHYAKPLHGAMPLETWLRQQGLANPEQLQSWLSQLFNWCHALLNSELIAPGLTSWNVWVKADNQLWFSEWEYLDHLKGPVGFHPISYDGYASPVQLSQGLLHPKTFWYSVWCLCFQLASGKSPALWSPQPPTPDTYRYLWHRDFYSWMNRFRNALVGEEENSWVNFKEFQPPRHTFKTESVWQSARDANQLFWQGMKHFNNQNWAEAGEHLQAAIEGNLQEPQHYRFLGKVFMGIKDIDSAMGCYEKALHISPLAVFYFEIGQCLMNILETKPALTFLKQAVNTFPQYWQAWTALGEAFQQLDQMDRAAESYLQAIKTNPKYPYPYRGLHAIYNKLGMKEQAKKYLKIYEEFDLGEPFFQIHYSEDPRRTHNYEIKCADGHPNKLTVSNCQVCNRSLYLLPNESIHEYIVDEILVPGRYHKEIHSLSSQVALVHLQQSPEHRLILKESFLVGQMTLRAQAEKHALSKAKHPGIPKIHDSFEENSHFYLITDFIEGISAKKYVSLYGSLSEELVRQIFAQILSIIELLQSQEPSIIHADIKPDNIFVNNDMTQFSLLDFNAACEFAGNDTRSLGCTPIYSPPEQEMFAMVNCSSDIYALGVSCINLLTGLPPLLFYDSVSKQFKDWDVYCNASTSFKTLINDMTVYRADLRPYPNIKSLLPVWRQVQKIPPLPQSPAKQEITRLMQQLVKVRERDQMTILMQQLNPLLKHYVILRLSAFRYFRMELLEEAEATAKTLLALKPTLISGYFTLAEIYLQQQHIDKACKVMETALSYCDDDYGIYHTLGRIYHQQKRIKRTLAAYKKVEELNPTLYQAQLEAAYILYENDGWREAAEKCLRILRMKPQLFEAHQLLGMAYGRMRDYFDACKHLREALALEPQNFEVQFNLGVTLFQMKEYNEAGTYFENCLQQQPNHPESQTYLLRCQEALDTE